MDGLIDELTKALEKGSKEEDELELNKVINDYKKIIEAQNNINSLSKEQAKDELKRIKEAKKNLIDYRRAVREAGKNGLISEDAVKEFENEIQVIDRQILNIQGELSKKAGGAISQVVDSFGNAVDSINDSVFGFANELDNFLYKLEKGDTFTGNVIKLNEDFLDLKTNLGLTVTQLDSFSKNIKQASVNAGVLGFNISDIINFQKQLSQETGTYNILSKEDIERVAVLRRALPEIVNELPALMGAFDRLGFGPTEAVEAMGKIVKESNKAGVNANKVAQNVSKTLQNAGLLARFRGGIQDVTKMAIQAEKFKLSMDAVFTAADKGRDLEGSIDAVSQLNLLGGKFAEIDPFSFLDMSRNDPEALQRTIAEMVSDLGTIQEDGTIGFSSVDIDRIRAAADAMGISFEELRRSAERTAKLNVIDSLLPSDLTEDQKNLIANFAQVRKGGRATVEVDGFGTVDVSQINDEQLAVLQKMQEEQDKTTVDKQAEAAISSAEYLRNIRDILKGIPVNLAESPLRTETAFNVNSGVRNFFGGTVGDFTAQAYGPGDVTQKAEDIINFVKDDLPKKIENLLTGENSMFTDIIKKQSEESSKQLEVQKELNKSMDDSFKMFNEKMSNVFSSVDLSNKEIKLTSNISLNLNGKELKKVIVESAPEIIGEQVKQDAGQ